MKGSPRTAVVVGAGCWLEMATEVNWCRNGAVGDFDIVSSIRNRWSIAAWSLLCMSILSLMYSISIGYITGAGKTAVILIQVSRVRVRCEILPPVATLYPLLRYQGL